MKYRLVDYPTIISTIVIMLMAGIIAGYSIAMMFSKDTYYKEYAVRVLPHGTRHYPYPPWHHYDSTLRYQDFRVVIKNGSVIHTEWLGYSKMGEKPMIVKEHGKYKVKSGRDKGRIVEAVHIEYYVNSNNPKWKVKYTSPPDKGRTFNIHQDDLVSLDTELSNLNDYK